MAYADRGIYYLHSVSATRVQCAAEFVFNKLKTVTRKEEFEQLLHKNVRFVVMKRWIHLRLTTCLVFTTSFCNSTNLQRTAKENKVFMC